MSSNPTYRDKDFDSLRAESQSNYAQERAKINHGPDAEPYTQAEVAQGIAIIEQEQGAGQRAEPRGPLDGTPFAHANEAVAESFRTRFAHLSGGATAGEVESAKQAALDAFLAPYYKGRGRFEGTRFLADLETTKGAKLTRAEVVMFGTAVGNWTGLKLAGEVQAELEAAQSRNATATEINSIVERGLVDALTATS